MPGFIAQKGSILAYEKYAVSSGNYRTKLWVEPMLFFHFSLQSYAHESGAEIDKPYLW